MNYNRYINEIVSAAKKVRVDLDADEIELGDEDNFAFAIPDIFYAEVMNFGNCCGGRSLGNFGFHNAIPPSLATVVGKILRKMLLLDSREDKYAVVYATTILCQAAANQILPAAGFKVIRKFRNPNTNGTQVTVWEWLPSRRK